MHLFFLDSYFNYINFFRFVPVDSIKHSPSIFLSSLETAVTNQDFSLEFCSRERSLPYFKMIHSRVLLGAIDANLQSIDLKTVFLLAEATIWFLKNIVSQLASRSELKNRIRCESAYENFKINQVKNGIIINGRRKKVSITLKNFDSIPIIYKKSNQIKNANNSVINEEEEIQNIMTNNAKNPSVVPINKLPTTLFDLQTLLRVRIFYYNEKKQSKL